jgi:hypothetical protein
MRLLISNSAFPCVHQLISLQQFLTGIGVMEGSFQCAFVGFFLLIFKLALTKLSLRVPVTLEQEIFFHQLEIFFIGLGIFFL